MIEIFVVILALSVLTIEYFEGRKKKTGPGCKVWVQEYGASDWICVDDEFDPGKM